VSDNVAISETIQGLCYNNCQSRSIAASKLLLWSAKVTKALLGKRLLYTKSHAAQAARTTGRDILPHLRSHNPALLQNLQCLFSTHKATIVLPALAEAVCRREEKQDKKQLTERMNL
jgi:hypothetical protein